MVWMSSYITIGEYVFRHVNSISIQSDMNNITDTCTIKLPNVKGMLEKKIKPGQFVTVSLGYDDNLIQEFTGYVSTISPKIPLEIICEDQMWLLKQKTVLKEWDSIKLKDVLKYLVPDAKIECPDITLAPLRLGKTAPVSIAKALQELKDEYGLVVYFRNGKLFCGLAYTEDLGSVSYHFQKNAIMGDLTFKTKEDFKLKVHAVSMMPDNSKIEVELGDEEGEVHTLHFYNLSKEELTTRAKTEMEDLRYDGYRGSFIGKGVPVPKHGMIASIKDEKYPERAGRYFIDAVNTDYNSSDGIKRVITLGKKAA